MKTIKHIERLQRLHYLIQQECTGSPAEIADRLEISERTVYYLIEQLKASSNTFSSKFRV